MPCDLVRHFLVLHFPVLHFQRPQFGEYFADISEVILKNFTDSYYSKTVYILRYSNDLRVLLHFKTYYKFWWSEELTGLKAIASTKYDKKQVYPRNLRNGDKELNSYRFCFMVLMYGMSNKFSSKTVVGVNHEQSSVQNIWCHV